MGNGSVSLHILYERSTAMAHTIRERNDVQGLGGGAGRRGLALDERRRRRRRHDNDDNDDNDDDDDVEHDAATASARSGVIPKLSTGCPPIAQESGSIRSRG